MLAADRLQGRVDSQIPLRILGYFVDLAILRLQLLDQWQFLLAHQQKRFSFSPVPRCPANPVHVYVWLVRRIHLKDPVDLGKIQPSSRDVRAEKDPVLLLAESEVDGHPFGLLLMPLQLVKRRPELKLSE